MKSMRKIGIIAVWKEADPLLKLMTVETVKSRGQSQFHSGELAGCQVVVAQISMGKVPTAAAAQHLIDGYGVDLLISCGSAGALDSRLQVGDIVLANKLVPHDFGQYTDEGFNYLGVFDGAQPDGLHYHRYLMVDPDLLVHVQQAATLVEWSAMVPIVRTGCIASGDQIIASRQKKQWLVDTFNAIAVEMESGAMAQVALMNTIPWLAVRAISDQADAALDFDLPSLITYSDQPDGVLANIRRRSAVIMKLAKHPNHLKAIMQIRKGVQQAAHNAAQATAAIIAEL